MDDRHTPPRRWEADPLSQLLVRVESQQHQINELRDSCVTKQEFNPVKLIAYGLVALIVMTVVTAIVGLVLTGGRGHAGP